MTIKANIENQNRKRKIDLSRISRISKNALGMLFGDDVEVNIVFLSSQKIRYLNRIYLGSDTATDVIAFSPGKAFSERGRSASPGKRSALRKKERFIGDIAISSDRASRNARIFRTSFDKELALYVIHGILHLAGYRDAKKQDRERMRRKENELLQKTAGIRS